jgi:sec-independent protein translocase protein TatA
MGFIFSSLGTGEILLILVAALLLFGAEKFPSITRALGKALGEMRKAANEFSFTVMNKEDLLSSPGQDLSERRNQRENEESPREG